MPAVKLLAKLALYYALMGGLVLLALWIYPPLQDNLPIGRVQGLLAKAGDLDAALSGIRKASPSGDSPLGNMPSFLGSLIWLGVAMLGALAAAWPVSQIYMNVRSADDYDQSLVDTILVLPLVVTSIVIIVQHSLALAFSLAGVASAVRFRNNLKSSGDLLFVLLAIAIGLSAGIGALELALLSSGVFNLCFVMLWFTSYGERANMKRFLGEISHSNALGPAKPARIKSLASVTEADASAGPRKMKQSDYDAL